MVELTFEQGRVVNDPFQSYGFATGFAGGAVWGRNDIAELQWLTPDGDVRQIARWEAEWHDVDEDVWTALGEAYTERMAGNPERGPSDAAAEYIRERRPIASKQLPLFRWFVVAPDGVDFGTRFRLLDVNREFVLGVEGVRRLA